MARRRFARPGGAAGAMICAEVLGNLRQISAELKKLPCK
jgi:hypothetical protein